MTKSMLAEPLGLYGWTRLEPVLLAALATENPILLVGGHGCAKSFLLERLAEALQMKFKCYNASLINYDDLVGIPMPTDDRKSLTYIGTETAIWDAEVVFIDELNRTRPELQNKLFPIIHERRIQGNDLSALRFRWAAMNPPCDDDANEDDDNQYLGAEPLDPALADRFPFIIQVPAWNDLTDDERKDILIDQFAGRHEFPVDIHDLIARTKEELQKYAEIFKETLASFVITLVQQLTQAKIFISTRRATMLMHCILAVWAAKLVLRFYAENKMQPAESENLLDATILAVENAMPQTARKPLEPIKLLKLVKNAWDISKMHDNDPEKRLLEENDPVKRLELALQLRNTIPCTRLAEYITSGIGASQDPYRRALCLATYLAVKDMTQLPATCIETLANELKPVFTPTKKTISVLRQKIQTHEIIEQEKYSNQSLSDNPTLKKIRHNLMVSLFPDGFSNVTVDELNDYFCALCKKILVSNDESNK